MSVNVILLSLLAVAIVIMGILIYFLGKNEQ